MMQGLANVHPVDPDRLAILGGLDLLDHVRPLHVHVLLAPLHPHPEGGLEGAGVRRRGGADKSGGGVEKGQVSEEGGEEGLKSQEYGKEENREARVRKKREITFFASSSFTRSYT